MLTVFATIYALLLLRAPSLRFRGCIALFVTVSVVDVWSHAGLAFPSLGHLEAVPLLLVAACVIAECRAYIARREFRALVGLFVVGAALVALVAWMLSRSALLPGHDPIATPTFARLIRQCGAIPATEAPIDERVWYYPPGFAIALSFFNWLPPLTTLWVFKAITIGAVAFTPLTWWLVARRFLLTRVDSWVACASGVFGFALFDRTLYLVPAFAGKNSQLLVAALVPIAFETMISARTSWRQVPIAVFAIAGSILVHFSAIYMLAALFGFWILARGQWKPIGLLRVSTSFVIGVMLTAPRLLAALHEHPDARPITTPYGQRWGIFVDALFGESSPALFIFADLDIVWPYKGVVLLTMGGLAFGIWLVARRTRPSLARLALIAALGSFVTVCLLMIYAGVVPVPVSADFARWFLYDFTALAGALFFITVASLFKPARRSAWYPRAFAVAVAVAVVGEVAFPASDVRTMARVARENYASNREVGKLFEQLQHWNPATCALMSRGSPSVGGRVIQDYKPFEYVPAFSSCYFANGSWLSLSSGLDPACDGQPSESCADEAKRLHPNDTVYVVEDLGTAPATADTSIALGPYYLRLAR